MKTKVKARCGCDVMRQKPEVSFFDDSERREAGGSEVKYMSGVVK